MDKDATGRFEHQAQSRFTKFSAAQQRIKLRQLDETTNISARDKDRHSFIISRRRMQESTKDASDFRYSQNVILSRFLA